MKGIGDKALFIVAVPGALALVVLTFLNILPLSRVEALGYATGTISVWLARRNNVWNWPIGLANSALYVWIFFAARLYADTALQVFYIVIGFYGWYLWTVRGPQDQQRPIGRAPWVELLLVTLLAIVATSGVWAYLRTTNDAAPFLDAVITVGSVVAQYLLARRYLEAWYIYIGVDVISIPLYISKGLPLTGALYAIFLLICVSAALDWRVRIRERERYRRDEGIDRWEVLPIPPGS